MILTLTLITILNARSPKVTKLIVQVFQMRKGKLLLNIKEIEKSVKRTKLTALVKDILLKMSTDGNYLTKTRKLL